MHRNIWNLFLSFMYFSWPLLIYTSFYAGEQRRAMRSLCWKFRNGAGVPECCQGISCCRNRRWLSQSSLSPITTNHSPHRCRYQILFFSVPIGFFRKGAASFSRGIAETSGVNRPHVRVALRDESVSVWVLCRGRSKDPDDERKWKQQSMQRAHNED